MDSNRKRLGALIIGVSPKQEDAEKEPGASGKEMEQARSMDELRELHDEALNDVFDALKADDRDAFAKAFSSAMRVCMLAEKEGLYEGEDEDEGSGEES